MAEVKWIKIVTDIFDDEKILLIESLPEADSIIVIWFKLLCLAGKQNNSGVFTLNGTIPYTDKMFSTIFRRKESTVQLALSTFEQFGMIEIINDTITIPNWGKHQNLESLENRKSYMKDYMKEYRDKQKQITQGGGADTAVAGTDLLIDWKTLKSIFGDRCIYCGKSEDEVGTLQKDHIVSFSKDGEFVLGNIAPACKSCNCSKRNKNLKEWYVEQAFFSQERLDVIEEYQKNTDLFLRKHLRKHLHKRNVSKADKEVYKEDTYTEEKRKKEPKTALEIALEDYKEHRKKMKSPMSERTVELVLAKLDRLANSESEKIAILNQSIENGWKGIFELKPENRSQSTSQLGMLREIYNELGESEE